MLDIQRQVLIADRANAGDGAGQRQRRRRAVADNLIIDVVCVIEVAENDLAAALKRDIAGDRQRRRCRISNERYNSGVVDGAFERQRVAVTDIDLTAVGQCALACTVEGCSPDIDSDIARTRRRQRAARDRDAGNDPKS